MTYAACGCPASSGTKRNQKLLDARRWNAERLGQLVRSPRAEWPDRREQTLSLGTGHEFGRAQGQDHLRTEGR